MSSGHQHGPDCDHGNGLPTGGWKVKANERQMTVTLISGFLGSGKTSLLSHVLTNKESTTRCAVIVNEISEFNIDALAVESGGLLKTDEKMVEMDNGCICCTLREDLLDQLHELWEKGFDAALIESSGIAEPMMTAETFFFPYQPPGALPWEPTMVLQEIAPLDNCVTIVDGANLTEHMQSMDTTRKLDKNIAKEDDHNIASLLFDQLEFANVVILNKVDMLPNATSTSQTAGGDNKSAVTVESLTQLIKKINPHCEVIPTSHSKVDLAKIIKTGNFTEDFASRCQGWMDDVKEAKSLKPQSTETEEYGVSSMSYTPKTAFHPQRLMDWIKQHFVLAEMIRGPREDAFPDEEPKAEAEQKLVTEEEEQEKKQKWDKEVAGRAERRTSKYGNLFRGKGFCWIGQPKRSHIFASWSQAGTTLNFAAAGTWDKFPESDKREPVKADPGQRLIFIGQDLNKEQLRADLDACLLTAEESAQLQAALSEELAEGQEDSDRKNIFPDPWGPFRLPEPEEDEEDGYWGEEEEGEESEDDEDAPELEKKE